MKEHISEERALFLVALSESDPEKAAARDHAAECSSCARLLAQSTAMFRLLDQAKTEPQIEPALAVRIRAAVFAAPAKTWHWEHVAWVLGALLSAGLIWLDGKPGRPLEAAVGLHCLRFELALGLLAFGATIAWTRLSAPLGALRGSVLAMTGALVGQTLLRTRCEAADAALHLLVFHGLGVVVATALGGLAGLMLEHARVTPSR